MASVANRVEGGIGKAAEITKSNRPPLQVVVCASGGGGNLQAIVEGSKQGLYQVMQVIVDRDCGAISIAEKCGIPCQVVPIDGSVRSDHEFLSAIMPTAQMIVLAGYMPIVSRRILNVWDRRMINTHPSLLPRHGGLGMYGVRVQEAVLASADSLAGCTVHYVSEVVDGGEIIAQVSIPVIPGESAWNLGGRVFEQEGPLLVKVLNMLGKDQNELAG